VYRATAPNGNDVAVKVVSLAKLRFRNKRLTEQRARAAIHREVTIQRQMAHENVVSLVDFYELPEKEKFYLVLELAGESIEQFVPLPSWVTQSVFCQLLLGLEHIHLLGVVHRDIKPANLMVTEQQASSLSLHPNRPTLPVKRPSLSLSLPPPPSLLAWLVKKLKLYFFPKMFQVVKISDFGEAQEISTFTGASRGTAMFMAPELAHAGLEPAQGQADVPTSQGYLVDIWAAGLSMYYAVTCQLPFNAASLDELFDKFARSEPPSANRKLAECGQ